MTLFLSFNRFLSRVESWNGSHMLIFPRRHAATFSNDFGWNINAILRKLSINHSLFCFFVVDPIYLESTVKKQWIPFVFCLFCICLRLFLTHLSPTNTLIWKFASTHTVTHARVHTKKWKHQKKALPTSCLVSSLQAMVSVCTSTTETVWSLKLLHLSHRTLLNLANCLKTFPWYSFTSTVLRSTTNRAQTVWQIHDESLSAAKWIWVLNRGMKGRK